MKIRDDAFEQYNENWINTHNVALRDLDASQNLLALNGNANVYLQDSNAKEQLLALNNEFEFDMGVDEDNLPNKQGHTQRAM